MHMSKQGIYDQLTSDAGDKFDDASAQYAVDHVKADWNKNALKAAESTRRIKTCHQKQFAISLLQTQEISSRKIKLTTQLAIYHNN